MHYLQKKQSRFAYLPWLQQLQDYGEPVDVRGHKTREFLNCVTEITEPWHHCILLPSRRWNPFLALSEALWILAGRDDVAALRPYNSHISDYSDDGRVLYGAYGARIYHQIDPLIERLRKDPSDRRAVLQIWDNNPHHFSGAPPILQVKGITKEEMEEAVRKFNPNAPAMIVTTDPETRFVQGNYDLTTESKDPPCNNMVYFKLRDNKLHMTVINRSNDLHFGLMAVNLPTFGILQSYIAARLGVEMGTQTHFSNSLHIYTDEPRAKVITERMLYNESEDMPAYPIHDLVFGPEDFYETLGHPDIAEACSKILDGYWHPLGNKFLEFAMVYLEQYRSHKWSPDSLPNKEKYWDWVIAGELFISKVWK